jgi:hypothetical protein
MDERAFCWGLRQRPHSQPSSPGPGHSTRSEPSFCFEDAELKIRIATVQFDEYTLLIVFPLNCWM